MKWNVLLTECRMKTNYGFSICIRIRLLDSLAIVLEDILWAMLNWYQTIVQSIPMDSVDWPIRSKMNYNYGMNYIDSIVDLLMLSCLHMNVCSWFDLMMLAVTIVVVYWIRLFQVQFEVNLWNWKWLEDWEIDVVRLMIRLTMRFAVLSETNIMMTID